MCPLGRLLWGICIWYQTKDMVGDTNKQFLERPPKYNPQLLRRSNWAPRGGVIFGRVLYFSYGLLCISMRKYMKKAFYLGTRNGHLKDVIFGRGFTALFWAKKNWLLYKCYFAGSINGYAMESIPREVPSRVPPAR
jgi:hypothetical protein